MLRSISTKPQHVFRTGHKFHRDLVLILSFSYECKWVLTFWFHNRIMIFALVIIICWVICLHVWDIPGPWNTIFLSDSNKLYCLPNKIKNMCLIYYSGLIIFYFQFYVYGMICRPLKVDLILIPIIVYCWSSFK